MTQTQEFVAPPPNHGCEECLKPPSRENEMVVHYSNQHGGRWLCSRCFFTLRPDWPQPEEEEEDMETKKKLEMLMLAEKVMKYIEGNVNDPARIKNAIARYREKRNEK